MNERLVKQYHLGVGKLLHMMRWSIPDKLNAVRELSKHMMICNKSHLKAMHKVMAYVCSTANKGLMLKPKQIWKGDRKFQFEIEVYSDATWASDPDTRKSVSGSTVFLEGSPVSMKI